MLPVLFYLGRKLCLLAAFPGFVIWGVVACEYVNGIYLDR
jgi:hypothetical protein